MTTNNLSSKSIAIVVDQRILAGGGFNQAIQYCHDLSRAAQDQGIQVLIFTLHKESYHSLQTVGLSSRIIRLTVLDKLYMWFLTLLKDLFLPSSILRFFPLSKLEVVILRQGAPLVLFASPSWFPLSFFKTSFISCIWDICHRDHPEFPEVSHYGELERREYILHRIAASAIALVTDSLHLKTRFSSFYSIDPDRVSVTYFGKPPLSYSEITERAADTAHHIPHLPSEYLYYPAQFWPHKNHTLLLRALAFLNSQRTSSIHLVLTGSDYGNLRHIKAQISHLTLNACVHLLGFVEKDLVDYLYANCSALVMPSYFGPTNLPPIEAANYRKPLVLPISPGYIELFGRYPFYYEQGNLFSLAKAIQSVYDQPEESLERGLNASDHLATIYSSAPSVLSHINSFFVKSDNWHLPS